MPALSSNLADSNGTAANITQVTGPVVFWAMLAIVLNAMAQDSPLTTPLSARRRGQSEGLLSLWLSSPFFCAAEALYDLYKIIYFAVSYWRPQTEVPVLTLNTEDNSIYSIKIITVRVVLVIFGVIPQAVRLFGMTGLPWAQSLAGVYLATSLLRLARICLENGLGTAESRNADEPADQGYFSLAGFALWLLHYAALVWLWNYMAGAIKLDINPKTYENARDVYLWIQIVISIICIMAMMLWILNLAVMKNPRLHKYHPGFTVGIPTLLLEVLRKGFKLLARDPRAGDRTTFLNKCFLSVWCLALVGASSWLLARLLTLLWRPIQPSWQSEDVGQDAKEFDNFTIQFAFWNLSTAWIFYAWVWNGSGTSMPDWESWLG